MKTVLRIMRKYSSWLIAVLAVAGGAWYWRWGQENGYFWESNRAFVTRSLNQILPLKGGAPHSESEIALHVGELEKNQFTRAQMRTNFRGWYASHRSDFV